MQKDPQQKTEQDLLSQQDEIDVTFEDYMKRLEREGYISERDGAPLKCLWCDSKDLEEIRLYEEYMHVETRVICNDCGKHTGLWSYGTWYT